MLDLFGAGVMLRNDIEVCEMGVFMLGVFVKGIIVCGVS